mmetsp:Transcript_20152/g.57182  ORF Transcript_20152/g.57182 Transcript_20152/m.57182 type:complete len:255 (-) Transcript_20152:250-1014(-)
MMRRVALQELCRRLEQHDAGLRFQNGDELLGVVAKQAQQRFADRQVLGVVRHQAGQVRQGRCQKVGNPFRCLHVTGTSNANVQFGTEACHFSGVHAVGVGTFRGQRVHQRRKGIVQGPEAVVDERLGTFLVVIAACHQERRQDARLGRVRQSLVATNHLNWRNCAGVVVVGGAANVAQFGPHRIFQFLRRCAVTHSGSETVQAEELHEGRRIEHRHPHWFAPLCDGEQQFCGAFLDLPLMRPVAMVMQAQRRAE